MKIIALMSVYNEELYLRRCLSHLREQGIAVYLIDNGSTDRTREIAETFLGNGVIGIETLPRQGIFELERLLRREEAAALELGADWYIHHDADEIRQAPNPYRTLREGIEAADRAGYNAVNFDEFVFVPTADGENYEHDGYVDEMRYYYFFEPGPERRINAWKNPGQPVDLHSAGGHQVIFPGRKVYPENFIMRHYMALSRSHLIKKYCGRVVSEAERRGKGWNNARASLRPDQLRLPARSRLKQVSPDNTWERDEPWKKHAIFENAPLLPLQADLPQDGAGESPPALFLVGLESSGTALLREALNHHSRLSMLPGKPLISILRRELGEQLNDREAFISVLKRYLPESQVEALAASVGNLQPFRFADGIRRYYQLHHTASGKSRWGVESPPCVTDMETIQQVLPEARFLHLIRDGRDLALSLPAEITPEDAAGHWVWTIAQARRQAQNLSHYREIRYEDLLAAPGKILGEICDFFELPREPAPAAAFATMLANTHDPAGRWQSALPPADLTRYQSIAETILAELGYSLSS